MNIDGKTLDIKQNNLSTLHELFPSVFSEDKVDLEKFKALFCDDISGNDEFKTNTALQMRDAGVEFRTI